MEKKNGFLVTWIKTGIPAWISYKNKSIGLFDEVTERVDVGNQVVVNHMDI